MKPYLVTYTQIITLKNNHTKITTSHRAFVSAKDVVEAINLVEDFLKVDEESSNGVVSHTDIVALPCKHREMLFDSGTYVNKDKNTIWHEGAEKKVEDFYA